MNVAADFASGADAPRCPICESAHSDVYVAGESEPLTATSIGQSRVHQRPGRVLRCRDCGHGYRAVRPEPAALAALYAEQDVETYVAEVPGRSRTARQHWELVKHLMSRGRLLDVGSASGLFLERVGRAGWKATGVEPSPALCAYARDRVSANVEIQCATLETADLPREEFDMVTLWDVLEHAPDPRVFLRAAAAPLKPGGFLLLNVPHLESRVARMLGKRWPLLLPEHLNYFTRDSLLRCAEDAGLLWSRFDQRLAYFSVGHVFRRLQQHGVPLAGMFESLSEWIGGEDWVVPVPLGEIVGVFRKPLD